MLLIKIRLAGNNFYTNSLNTIPGILSTVLTGGDSTIKWNLFYSIHKIYLNYPIPPMVSITLWLSYCVVTYLPGSVFIPKSVKCRSTLDDVNNSDSSASHILISLAHINVYQYGRKATEKHFRRFNPLFLIKCYNLLCTDTLIHIS